MKKSFQSVNEVLAAQREALDKIANLDEIAQKRELNEEEKKTLAALQREHESLKREASYMLQQQQASSIKREEKPKGEILREVLKGVREGKISRELTLGKVGGNEGGSITESGAINLTIHDIIPTLNEGLGLPSTARIVTGVTGNELWPVSVDDADLEEVGENAELTDQNLHFDNIQPASHRVGLSIAVSNSAIDNAAFDLMGFVQGKKELLMGQISGVMKAALDGVKRDGDGRKIDGLRELFDAANDGKGGGYIQFVEAAQPPNDWIKLVPVPTSSKCPERLNACTRHARSRAGDQTSRASRRGRAATPACRTRPDPADRAAG